MKAFFTGVEGAVIAAAVAFVFGVLFSQKIKDWFKGIPTDVRAQLTRVEVAVRAKLAVSHVAAVAPAIAAVAPALVVVGVTGVTGPKV